MQKIKIGHRANFRAKNKCFRQILFPVRAILRSINFRYANFNTDSADACILVMACVDCARACSKKPFRASLSFVRARAYLLALMTQKPCAVGMRNAKLGNHLKVTCSRVPYEQLVSPTAHRVA